MLTHIIVIRNIIISGFTEHISGVLEDFLHAAIIIIILLHTVAMVHAVEPCFEDVTHDEPRSSSVLLFIEMPAS